VPVVTRAPARSPRTHLGDNYPYVSVRHARRPWPGLALYGAVVVVSLAALTWGVPWLVGRWT
jgi:hypothetical protein